MGCVQGKCCGDCCLGCRGCCSGCRGCYRGYRCCCGGCRGCCCCRCRPSDAGSSSSRHDGSGSGAGEVRPLNGKMLSNSTSGIAALPSHGFRLQYSALSLRGYYPDTPDRENQDAFCIRTNIQENPNLHFFGVFDGHGQYGAQCACFVRDKLVDVLSADPRLVDDPVKAYNSAFLSVNSLLHESEIDDSMSGTTAITVLVNGDSLFVANVGDSRAVGGVYEGERLIAEDLSHDQTPFRKDEYERVRLSGARVLSVDQVEGVKDPSIQSWGDEENDEGDPPRLWMQNAMYPGTAFTRSLGDSTAESIGVIAVPEVLEVKITRDPFFIVIASDGIFEFLSSQTVVDMVGSFKDPNDACSALVAESYKIWLQHESRTDDMTVIVVDIKDLCNPVATGASSETPHLGKARDSGKSSEMLPPPYHFAAAEQSPAVVAPDNRCP